MKERAQEDRDKKKEDMQKLRMESREQAKQIRERKDKQLKALRNEKLEKTEEDTKGNASPKGNSKIPERGRSPY